MKQYCIKFDKPTAILPRAYKKRIFILEGEYQANPDKYAIGETINEELYFKRKGFTKILPFIIIGQEIIEGCGVTLVCIRVNKEKG